VDEFFDRITEALPQSVQTPHWRLAGSMLTENTETEFRSVQFIGQKLNILGIAWRAANRADAAFDLLVNNLVRVQVKVKASATSFPLRRSHWKEGERVTRPYRSYDFDFLVAMEPDAHAPFLFHAWVIPMTWLVLEGFVTAMDIHGSLVPIRPEIFSPRPADLQVYADKWNLLNQKDEEAVRQLIRLREACCCYCWRRVCLNALFCPCIACV
jgi:hypothetical protein